MKKEIFYLIGAVAGALLVLLAVPLGNAYIGNYLSVYGGMDTQSYVLLGRQLRLGVSVGQWRRNGYPELCAAHAERGNGLSDPGRCSSGTLRRGVSFPAQTVSNDFILECPGVQLYAGAFLIVLFGEFPSMCSVENFLPPLDKWIRQLYYSIVI